MKTLTHILFLVTAFSLLFAQTVGASDGAEVFDIKKGEIILTIKNSNSLQNQVKEWLSSANGTIESLKIEPSDGIAIKIPLEIPPLIPHQIIEFLVISQPNSKGDRIVVD